MNAHPAADIPADRTASGAEPVAALLRRPMPRFAAERVATCAVLFSFDMHSGRSGRRGHAHGT